MFTPRPYQLEIASVAADKLKKLRIVALSMEVRTGKTCTSLMTCQLLNVKKVLFVTKKKAIDTIKFDYDLISPSFEIVIINYESVHKVTEKDFDMVICDEFHSMGNFPKPSQRAKRLKEIVGQKYLILLSGTPTPESYSQIFHPFWISQNTPFPERNFYQWANTYVTVKQRYVAHGNKVNDYSNANEKLIREVIGHYMISLTQKEAGFTSAVEEKILQVRMKPVTYSLVDHMRKNLVFTGKNGGVILGDTPVKLMQKIHQLFSGTVKLEDGTAAIIDDSKALFIRDHFKGQKIAIFYKFIKELELLKEVFGKDLTTELPEFETTDKSIALQVQAGREGISLKQASCLVFMNIDFSATSYWQARARLATQGRKDNTVYWVFSEGGMEQKIYQTVQLKKNYTLSHFKQNYGVKIPA